MKDLLRKVASKLPVRHQQELKRLYFSIQINRDRFKSSEPEFSRIGEWIEKGDWVLDVGANIGHYTKKFSDVVGSNGRVLAFEPVPQTFELLVANAADFKFRNVTLLNLAISDQVACVGLSMPKFDTGLQNYYRAQVASEPTELNSITITIDQLEIPKAIRLAKIDVEGHEVFVLRGMRKLIERDHPILIVEGNSARVERFLQELGYVLEEYEGSPNRVYRPIEPKP